MNERSEAVLLMVHPLLADKVRTAAAKLGDSAIFLCVVSGLRSAREQDALYQQGRTTPGPIVTNAKVGGSMHNYGLAVDVVPYLIGETGGLNWVARSLKFRIMVAAMRAAGLVWGGDWPSFPDPDHFQLAGVPSSPSQPMRNDYGAGTEGEIQAVWRNVVARAYEA